MRHEPVLLQEIVAAAQLQPGMFAVDCTAGDGGHSEALLDSLGGRGRLLAIDKDPESLVRAKQHLYRFGESASFARASFVDLSNILTSENYPAPNFILADLGWSTPQFSERMRGFSFQLPTEALDMRFDPMGNSLTASDILNRFEEEEICKILRDYGEERFALDIAERIGDERKKQPISTVGQLVNIVIDVYKSKLRSTAPIPWIGGLHPATRTFQALRIAVNDELGVLERFIPQALQALAVGGRLAIISFHSLEDRIVKHSFKDVDGNGFSIITKKPIEPSPEECQKNPRAASAKLRIIQKIV